MMRRTHLSIGLAAMAMSACGGAEAPAAPSGPLVSPIELPLSFRNDAPEPADALQVEIGPHTLRLEGADVMELPRGLVPRAEMDEQGIPRLRTAAQSAPARSRAAIRAQGMVGWGTLARVMQSLGGAGYRELVVAVRTPGEPGANVHWMQFTTPVFVPAGLEEVAPEAYGGASRPWSDFVEHWQEAHTACSSSRNQVACDAVPERIREGGFMQMVLWTRQSGMMVRFNRVGIVDPPDPPPPPPPPPEPGIIPAPPPPPPARTGAFNFRAEAGTIADSPITRISQPICGIEACQVVVEGDDTTPLARPISLLGAAFPNGTAPPQLIIRIPVPAAD